jgi:hypothetical protein
LSPGGASGVYMFAATLKKTPDDVIEKSTIQLPARDYSLDITFRVSFSGFIRLV